jgi:ribosomal protein L6P/L9E
MEIKQIKIPTNIETFTAFSGESKFLIIQDPKNYKYFLVPNFVELCKKEDNLNLTLHSENKTLSTKFNLFHIALEFFLNNLETSYKKKLTLKGLGYRITVIENRTKLEFKVGYSHLIRLTIPEIIKVKTKKNVLKLESTNKIMLGNFVQKIISFRSPDSYKGKGF